MDSGPTVQMVKTEESVVSDIPEPDYSDSDSNEPRDLSYPTDTDLDPSSKHLIDEELPKQSTCDLEERQEIPTPDYLEEKQGIPEPDYSDNEEDETTESTSNNKTGLITAAKGSLDSRLMPSDDTGLIMPKKLVNPCLLSKEHKELRQELKLNHKIGRNPIEKPELIKVLKERQEKEKKKELEEFQKSKRTSFDKRLEEQAQKLSQAEKQQHEETERIKCEEEKPEFFKMHSKIFKTTMSNT